MRDAWQRLLRGGAVVVPSGASVWGQLVSSDELSFHDLSQVHTAVLEFLEVMMESVFTLGHLQGGRG